MSNKEEIANAVGRAWFDPKGKRFYGGVIGHYQGGILTDIAAIEAREVLRDLLGLLRPEYTLEQACRVVPTAELVLDVDTEAVEAGHRDVKPLESSAIRDKTFSSKHFECYLNEAKIVLEDRASMKARHDLMPQNVEDCAGEIQKMRNDDIAERMVAEADVAGLDWDDSDDYTDNPMIDITGGLKTIMCAGAKPSYVALNPVDWNYFLSHQATSMLVQAGIMKLGETPTLSVPGYPTVKFLIDCAITADHCIVGSQRAIILAKGPTESVKVRDEYQRFTAYIIRDYEQAQVVDSTQIIDITPITT